MFNRKISASTVLYSWLDSCYHISDFGTCARTLANPKALDTDNRQMAVTMNIAILQGFLVVMTGSLKCLINMHDDYQQARYVCRDSRSPYQIACSRLLAFQSSQQTTQNAIIPCWTTHRFRFHIHTFPNTQTDR